MATRSEVIHKRYGVGKCVNYYSFGNEIAAFDVIRRAFESGDGELREALNFDFLTHGLEAGITCCLNEIYNHIVASDKAVRSDLISAATGVSPSSGTLYDPENITCAWDALAHTNKGNFFPFWRWEIINDDLEDIVWDRNTIHDAQEAWLDKIWEAIQRERDA